MTIRTARCQCGQLHVACEGDPVRASVCHCLDCQRRTGSAFGVQARFQKDRVAVTGSYRTWVRTGDEGSRLSFNFCPDCGSTVFYSNDQIPGFTMVTVGAFAEPQFPAPSVEIYENRRHPWCQITLDQR